MTDLKRQAAAVASAGRGPDTMIMHVTPDEIRDISRMGIAAGIGPVGINPETGYPEAGFFGDLFKGIAKSLPGILGTAFLGPVGGALAQGLFTGATEDSWKKGLFAGLGTFMLGRGMDAALGAAKGAGQGAAQSATEAATSGATEAIAQGAVSPDGIVMPAITSTVSQAPQGALSAAGNAAGQGFIEAGKERLMNMPGALMSKEGLGAFGSSLVEGRAPMMVYGAMGELDKSIQQDRLADLNSGPSYAERLAAARRRFRERHGSNPYANLYGHRVAGYATGGMVEPQIMSQPAVSDMATSYMYTPAPTFDTNMLAMSTAQKRGETDGTDREEGGGTVNPDDGYTPGGGGGTGGTAKPRNGGPDGGYIPGMFGGAASFMPPPGYIPGFHPEFQYIGDPDNPPQDPREHPNYGGIMGGNPFGFSPFGQGGFQSPFGMQGFGGNPFMGQFGGMGGPYGGWGGSFGGFGFQPPMMQSYGGGFGMGGFGGFNPYASRSPYAFRGFAEGGMVNPMGGMGDGIPAEIVSPDGAAEPAALSPGEYVIPADVVSMVGDGDTDAGADQLDLMMRRIRMQKTGSEEQLPPLDPNTLVG